MDKWAKRAQDAVRAQEAKKATRKEEASTQEVPLPSASPDKALAKVPQEPEAKPKVVNGATKPEPEPNAPHLSKESQEKLNRWLNRSKHTSGEQKAPAAPELAQGKGNMPVKAVNGPNGSVSGTVVPSAGSLRLQRWMERVNTNPKPPSDLLDLSNQESPPALANGAGSDPNDPHGLSKLKETTIEGMDLHTAIHETKSAPRAADPSGQDGWQKISFENGDYEGEFKDGAPHGFGRIQWKNGVGYHGHFVGQKFHGKGCFFFENGDRCAREEGVRDLRREGRGRREEGWVVRRREARGEEQ